MARSTNKQEYIGGSNKIVFLGVATKLLKHLGPAPRARFVWPIWPSKGRPAGFHMLEQGPHTQGMGVWHEQHRLLGLFKMLVR